MRACVDANTCIGCGLCEATCPAVFRLQGLTSTVIADPVPPAEEDACRAARDGCPAGAISLSEEERAP